MVFLSLCTAIYDYTPQGDNELAIKEGELVYILEKSAEDDWWKAKKRAPGEAEDEPSGLIPNNYVQEARPTHHAKALYDYTRQTDEELSFSEDSALLVYDTSDPDWTLVGLNGEFGFAPANYIEVSGEAGQKSPASAISPQLPPRETDVGHRTSLESKAASSSGPAAALAGIMHRQADRTQSNTPRSVDSPTPNTSVPPRKLQYTPEASDEESPSPPAPSLPQRPPSQSLSPSVTQYASPRSPESPGVTASPPFNRAVQHYDQDTSFPAGGFHMYNINEMVSALGKKKKLPTTLSLNLATGKIIIEPEKSRDGPQQEWTAEKLTHYSIEGKHVFMELVRPSKSIDFHAGAKDTAQEIVAGLGEIAGAARAEGLREVLAAGSGSRGGQKKGQVLYDFMAQGSDEVTVAIGDEVIVIDDSKSDEWWMIRRLKNGNEGVVPSSYIEITGTTIPPVDDSGLKAARSVVEQNRLEEERLAKEAAKSSKTRGGDARGSEVGPGVKLPTRGSSLARAIDDNQSSSQRNKRDSKGHGRSHSSSISKPDASHTRTWTDRSGSFKVEAQFIGLKDGKIHLHKLNGVKIAVSVAKMAVEDLEYVERVTGKSLDDDKPLSEIRRRSLQTAGKDDRKKSQPSASTSKPGAVIEQSKSEPKMPEYDWFDFFLKAGVNLHQCERYAFNFNRDSMDEAVLPDITPEVLRTLGLKEGDILRVMKHLDSKYGRTSAKSKLRNVSFGGEEVIKGDEEGNNTSAPNSNGGGLFSGPGGALRNNTRKGRPAPAVQNDDVVNAKTFKQRGAAENKEDRPEPTQLASVPLPEKKTTSGFDDDAWDVKPSKQTPPATQPAPSAPTTVPSPPSQPPLTGALAELSLLSAPLQPTVVHSGAQQPQQPQPQEPTHAVQQVQQTQQTQPTGSNQPLFSRLPQQPTALQPQPQSLAQGPPASNFASQPTFQGQQTQQSQAPRQRPQAPQATQQGSLILPPPPRPLSAPQNVSQPSSFGPPPLQPQLTGAQNLSNFQNRIAPPGQSLSDMDQLRIQQLQQQYGQPQMYPQPTGYAPNQNPGLGQFGNGIPTQQSGYGQQFQAPPSFSNPLPFLAAQQAVSPFADPRSQPQQQIGNFQQPLPSQLTGYPSQSHPQPTMQPGSINSMLPPPLQPQLTGAPNGFATGSANGYSGGRAPFGQPPPPIPTSSPFTSQLQQQVPTMAPLQPQKTGPAPPIRFGVNAEAKKLVPQPTGRRANLSHATPQNPFGFD
ncbi:cytoskeletal protein binding protein [Pseudocyphellaria aurata]|nr:cytoskeletal protein binding protein [Pseudocyphellaria aurata]